MLRRVISGGQTGADQAGLRAARACGIVTGGWVPKGCRTLDGPMPELVTVYRRPGGDKSKEYVWW